MKRRIEQVIQSIGERGGRARQSAKLKLAALAEIARQLLPQIRHWLKTGKVASEKIIHAGIVQARSIVKSKWRMKFGMKWLINRVKGGYVFGLRVEPRASEDQMPEEGLKNYREVFGEKAKPKMLVYDRGASLPLAAEKLQAAGVKKVGIPPRGQGEWMVGEKDQKLVKSERGKTEGSIGRLKSKKYGFSHRQEPQPGNSRSRRPEGDGVGEFEYADARPERPSQSRELGASLNEWSGDEKEKGSRKANMGVFSPANYATRSNLTSLAFGGLF